MRLSSAYVFIATGCSLLPIASAWGAVGHEIVATIAMMYLHPSVLPSICRILGQTSKCHMAPVATWADKERLKMRWSGPLHYINSLDDFPSKTCAFPGPQGWAGTKNINVLDGIKNVTSILEDWTNHDASDEAAHESLKFLIHFLGDMHQPLHLVGRDKGGNGVRVLFDRRHTNLHSVWDNFLLAKAIRLVPNNYSRPLPYPQIEGALRRTIYDPYIRKIMWEGALNAWVKDIPTWLDCPAPTESFADVTMFQKVLSGVSNAFNAGIRSFKGGVDINPDGQVVCPYFWSQPIHTLNCDIIWPPELDKMTFSGRDTLASHDHDHDHIEEEGELPQGMIENIAPLDNHPFSNDASILGGILQLDTPQYAGVIAERMIIEKLLVQGGVRLAGLLNYLFAEDKRRTPFLASLV